MASTLVLLLQLLLVSPGSASLYFGGTTTFSYKGRNPDGSFRVDIRNRATFNDCQSSLSWNCYSGSCGHTTRNQRGVLDRSTNKPQNNSDWCETERVSTTYVPGDRPFQLRATDCCWTPTLNSINDWRQLIYVDLGTRSDTKQPNRSPDIAILPLLRVPQNCPRKYKLMSFDPDGDRVRCRYGHIKGTECSLCRHPSGFTLDQDSCTLYYHYANTTSTANGFELVVEDFPQGHIRLVYSDGSESFKNPLTTRTKREAHGGPFKKTDAQTTSKQTRKFTTRTTFTFPTMIVPTTTTEEPTTTAPLTTTEQPTTTAPTTTFPTTIVSTTEEPTTDVLLTTTEEPTTTALLTSTVQPTTTAPLTTTEQPTTDVLLTTTEEPTTAVLLTTTEEPTTTALLTSTVQPTTTAPLTTTEQPTTDVLLTTTEEPTTDVLLTTTEEPTTAVLLTTTEEPTTTALPTSTVQPTTTAPTTTSPITITEEPTTTTPLVTTDEPIITISITTTEEYTTTKAPTTTTQMYAATPALSKLPLQFLLLVDPPAPSCEEGAYLPKFVDPTPENGAHIQAVVGKELEIKVKAQATYSIIHDIIISGPLKVSKHRTTRDDFVIRWTPIPDNVGDHYSLCFAVESVTRSEIYQSEMRCVLVGVNKKQIKTNVICTESTMTVEVEKSSSFGLKEDHLQLNDPSNTLCSLQRHSNSTYVIAVIPLNACGTQIEEDEENLIFKNELTTVDNSRDLISRKDLLEVQFYCQYPKRSNITQGFTTHRKSVTVWEKGLGSFTYQFEFYSNDQFQTVIDPNLYPLEYEAGTRMYMQIEATSSVNDTELFVESCRAAPYDNPNYKPTYSIIENGCNVDPTVQIYSRGNKKQFKFSMEAFKFIGLYDQVYISCSVLMCEAGNPNTRCSHGCLSPSQSGKYQHHHQKREAVTQSANHFVSQGPLRLRRSVQLSRDTVSNLNLNLVFIAGCLLAAVGMLCGVVLYKAKMSGVKYQPLPTFEN